MVTMNPIIPNKPKNLMKLLKSQIIAETKHIKQNSKLCFVKLGYSIVTLQFDKNIALHTKFLKVK